MNGPDRPLTCLEEAGQLVDGIREGEYGHPADNFRRTTDAAKALGVNPLSGPLHHALYMVLLKVARLVETPDHHDSIVDIAGYARTYERVLEKEPSFEVVPTIEIGNALIEDVMKHPELFEKVEGTDNKWRLR